MEVKCLQCGKKQSVIPARAKTYKFCSYKCRGEWRKENFTGEANPNWKGGTRFKECQYCGKEFTNPIRKTFLKMKFCSKPCADKGGIRYKGKDNPNYRENVRRRNRCGSHRKWANAVISRDKATCQRCGATDTELHAHHVKSYKDHPELRFDVSNGLTLCCDCHWNEHSARNVNGVNSGKLLTGNAEDNPEPILNGNIRTGVTTRGRVYRRWEGHCFECGEFISRRPIDVIGKAAVFCNITCRGKWTSKWKTGKPKTYRYDGNSSTSAPHESDDIV